MKFKRLRSDGSYSSDHGMICAYSAQGHERKEQFLREAAALLRETGRHLARHGLTQAEVRINRAGLDLRVGRHDAHRNIVFNPSYFAPSEYRVFGQVTGKVVEWNRVIDTGYAVIARSLNATSGNATNGLVPAWCDVNGVPKPPSAGAATNYQYDSARTPFRMGQDYCYYGEPRAASYLAAISSFFGAIGAANIVDGYDLDGRPHPDPATPAGSPQSAVFVGSAAVGGVAADFVTPGTRESYLAAKAESRLVARWLGGGLGGVGGLLLLIAVVLVATRPR